MNFGVDPVPSEARRRPLVFALCIIPFVVLATLNSGGYRYGASDQSFYLPAVFLQLDPALFPRDAAVLAAQTHLTLVDELVAGVVRITGASLPHVFVALYVAALILLAWSAWRIGLRLYGNTWTAVALLAAFTLRHAIARSGTNTLEGYCHPRVIAFALGAAAVLFFLRGRVAIPAALAIVAGAVHPTTALWFTIWMTSAAAIAHPALRKYLAGALVAAGLASAWALAAGPLAGRLTIMDPEWRQTLAPKDYLFPLRWPPYAWIINLGYLPVIAWIYQYRQRAALVDPLERGLVLGSSSLAVVFAGALVLHAFGVTLAVQLQPARLFWMFDFLATIYAVWLIAEGGGKAAVDVRLKAEATRDAATRDEATRRIGRPQVAALIIVLFSVARGAYVLIEADRPAVQISVPDDDWGRVMAFARTTDKRSGWLAHPLHAVLYGTSVRVAGERDVFVEEVKDAAMGMYDRDVALRTKRRLETLPPFDALTAADVRKLGADYGLDFIVTEEPLELPLAFESGALRVYRIE